MDIPIDPPPIDKLNFVTNELLEEEYRNGYIDALKHMEELFNLPDEVYDWIEEKLEANE